METTATEVKQLDEKFCGDCGSIIKIKAEICPKCGVRQSNPLVVGTNGKSKITAALLAFFLGGFGFHKFYLGQTGMGILYLLFFWTFIPAIAAFVETILLLCMSEERFNQKFNLIRA